MIKKDITKTLFFTFLVFLLWSFYPQKTEINDFSEKTKIVLREVGNQLLLNFGDSTSLILPIKEIESKKFQISFQKELSFEPSILVKIVKSNLEKSLLSENYRVEVLRCTDKEVAYSYEINADKEKTIIPCAGRVLAIGCYKIQVKFLEKKSSKNNAIYYFLIPIILGIMYRLFFKINKVEPEKNTKNQTILGSFIFYPEQNKLVQKAKEITLSKKECELLEIFIANTNQVVKREELTKRVWEDNGVIVGRSLDTYISKLRKKLQEDNSIKLTNVHGIGYKLEVK